MPAPEDHRKRLIKKEHHPTGNLNDALNKSQNPSPDVSGMGWKDILFLIIIAIGGFFFYQWLF